MDDKINATSKNGTATTAQNNTQLLFTLYIEQKCFFFFFFFTAIKFSSALRHAREDC